jgi:anti-sigma factor RsiW
MSYAQHDPQDLIQYLLGSLPESEAERLDELAVTDDEFAWRLTEAENDLVDAYARGELSGETLRRFETHYLSSEKRREKVKFADALRLLEERSTAAPVEGAPAATPLPEETTREPVAISPRLRKVPRIAMAWALAAAALLMLVPAGLLFLANGRLRHELAQAQSERASLETRAGDLQRQLERQRSETARPRTDLDAATASDAIVERLQIVSLILSPQVRGLGRTPQLSVPPTADAVAMQLRLESDDFPRYRVSLRTAAGDQAIWRSGTLTAALAGEGKAVTASVPANLFTPQHYSAELSGVTAEGREEPLASYAFRVVQR